MPKRAASSVDGPLRRSTRRSAVLYKDESSSTEAEVTDESPQQAKKKQRKAAKTTATVTARSPRSRVKKEEDSEDEEIKPVSPTKEKKKKEKSASDLAAQKLRKLTSFVASPYPNFAHPTPGECERVVELLSRLHGPAVRPEGRPIDDTSAGAACGQVPSVLDALVRTILSQNTTSKNSTAAKRRLDETFGKGNWRAMHEAPAGDVEDAIRVGGLAPSKTATIKNVLKTAMETYGTFSLDHLHAVPNDEAMRELVSFKGVGPKTASCVLLFCMARDSFAVDTHVFRLSKALGWVPRTAGREETYGHLDLKIPAEFKYPLHTLLITHGKRCGRCSAHRKSGLLDPADCPLIGLSKTVKEEGGPIKKEEEEEEEEEEDDDDGQEVVVGGQVEVPEELRATMTKIEDGARQEARDKDGMAIE
ncbi:Putative uncharacterized protein [Taphrina deformans PYCC 5710]|uniref:HhH-GPD domain-containing protein n=1 Tax=Taphrina deformans (strain PYCC 5710 / ATCC 11124 / CBS 356.35 / IMI 108563 / JCM 9778 / NBRC 8474) TaxID=1097556 RepID=R4XCK0_TAPDE|nr:Putative uncharacterized protein [Taphrina deformans PYCC 5710]|eukprot:CCG82091.1 Putative uncharacterized protein [Taphrina deformans PYCC 5710]